MNNLNNWITEELTTTQTKKFETLPSLQLVENVVTQMEVDFSKKFEQWDDPTNKSIKAIIPVAHKGQRMNFWLNKANPLYRQLLEANQTKGQTVFNIMRTGQGKGTKYVIVEGSQ